MLQAFLIVSMQMELMNYELIQQSNHYLEIILPKIKG